VAFAGPLELARQPLGLPGMDDAAGSPGAVDEVDRDHADVGPDVEGKQPFDSADASPTSIDHTEPIFDYSHSSGGCTVIGGYVSRDQKVRSLFGRYLYADLCTGEIRSLIASANGASGDRKTGLPSSSGIATFGEDSRGRLYYANVGTGDVMAIRAKRGRR